MAKNSEQTALEFSTAAVSKASGKRQRKGGSQTLKARPISPGFPRSQSLTPQTPTLQVPSCSPHLTDRSAWHTGMSLDAKIPSFSHLLVSHHQTLASLFGGNTRTVNSNNSKDRLLDSINKSVNTTQRTIPYIHIKQHKFLTLSSNTCTLMIYYEK